MDTKFYALYGLDMEYIIGHKKLRRVNFVHPPQLNIFQTELFFFFSFCFFSTFCFISKTGFSHFS